MQLLKMKSLVLGITLVGMLGGCKLNEPLSLKIAHVNDTHSYFDEEVMRIGLPNAVGAPTVTYVYAGGYPRLKTKIDSLRNEAANENKEFLLLHAGDAFSGTLYFSLFKSQLESDFLNLFDIDAMAVGNHEFDSGNEELATFADSVNFPLLAANISIKGSDPLKDKLLPYSYKMVDGQPLAIVGLTTKFTEIISSPSDKTKFADTIETAKKTVKKISAMGINKIVFVTHLGIEEDRLLAKSVPGIDVIIGGHSGDLMGDFSNIGLGNKAPSPIMETDPQGNPVCIMHSGEYTKFIGETNVEFSGVGKVLSCEGQNVLLIGNTFAQGATPQPVNSETLQVINNYLATLNNVEVVQKDQTIQGMLEQAKLQLNAFSSTQIGLTNETLYHVRLPGDTHPVAGVMAGGSTVAPHVANSMAYKMESTSGKPYVAMMNAGGVRADLATPTLTVGSAYSVLPFRSTIVSMEVSGESLKNTLATNVANAFLISGVALPYVANIRYTINLTVPTAPKVENILIKDSTGVFQPISLTATYNLATTSYLSNGGDLYKFSGAANVVDTGHVDADVLIQYIKSLPGSVLNKPTDTITVVR